METIEYDFNEITDKQNVQIEKIWPSWVNYNTYCKPRYNRKIRE